MPTPSPEAARLLSRFGRLRGGGGEWWSTKCPAHDDRSGDSLHLREHTATNGLRVLQLKCHAGCERDAVIGTLGLTARDLVLGGQRAPRPSSAATAPITRPTAEATKPRQLARTLRYLIRDTDGKEVAWHIRREYDDGTKGFGWERDGQNTLGDLNAADLPLYGVHDQLGTLLPVFVVEGEKAAEALWRMGIQAVATCTGAANVPSEKALQPLLGLDVWLWPDNDGPPKVNPATGKLQPGFQGQRHMNIIAARLTTMGQVPGVINWWAAPLKGDAADWTAGSDAVYDLWQKSSVWWGGREIDGRWEWFEGPTDVEEEARKVLWMVEHKGELTTQQDILPGLFIGAQGSDLPSG